MAVSPNPNRSSTFVNALGMTQVFFYSCLRHLLKLETVSEHELIKYMFHLLLLNRRHSLKKGNHFGNFRKTIELLTVKLGNRLMENGVSKNTSWKLKPNIQRKYASWLGVIRLINSISCREKP